MGHKINIWLEDGTQVSLKVKGIYQIKGIQEENYSAILPFSIVEKSLYDKRFTNVYSHDLLVGSQENRYDFYRTSPAY
ncbi:hypothetical protein K4G93_24205, partial [Mycobacterium tuberculosis]|nr:hypothetical protein [Mycobacterium tuberculosis]